MIPSKLSEADIERVRARYRSGESSRQIAKDYPVGPSGIRHHTQGVIRHSDGRSHRRDVAIQRQPSLEWMDEAACLGVNGFTEMSIGFQQSYCKRCPVIHPCAELGIEGSAVTPGDDSVYGGMDPETRHKMQQQRRKNNKEIAC